LTQGVYASIENDIHREYDALLGVVSRKEAGGPVGGFEKMRQIMKMMYYNKAVLFSNWRRRGRAIPFPRCAARGPPRKIWSWPRARRRSSAR